jgi:dihydroorotate dehydrogenase (NAD+) catalytic subunit
LIRSRPQKRSLELTARIGRVVLPNPVMTASGTAGHGVELAAYLDLAQLGAVVVKSLSPEPWPGNPHPRVHEARAGMLNSVGLQNPGIERWLDEDLPALAATGARVVASIWGFTAGDYGRAAKALAAAAGDRAAAGALVAVEANISCPNVEDGSRMFAQSESGTRAAIEAAARALAGTGWPVWAKLSPAVTDITEIAGAALGAGAEALTLVNTLPAMAVDPMTGRPKLGGGGGGLSGHALHPVAVRAVYDCRRAFSGAAIIGVGGVTTGEDAAEFIAAGADAVQVGTATFTDPRAPARILAELVNWCQRHGVDRWSDLRRWEAGDDRKHTHGDRRDG